MSTEPMKISILGLALAIACMSLVVSGCKEVDPPLPEAPSGTKTFGTESNEVGTAIVNAPGGGYIVAAGVQVDQTDWDLKFLVLDANGELVSEKTIADPESKHIIRSMKPKTGGGYLAAGISEGKDQTYQGFFMELDADLNVESLFSTGIGYGYSYYYNLASYAEAFEINSNGWMLLTAQNSVVTITRVNANLQVIASRIITDQSVRGSSPSKELVLDAAGNIRHFTCQDSYIELQFAMQKLDPNTGYPDLSFDLGQDSIVNADNFVSITVGGTSLRSNGNLLVILTLNLTANYLFEVDPDLGTVLWAKRLQVAEDLFLVKEGADGRIHIAGHTATSGSYYPQATNSNSLVAIVDSVGGSLRRRAYGGTGQEVVGGLEVAPDGTTAVIGSTSSYGAGGSDIFLILYN